MTHETDQLATDVHYAIGYLNSHARIVLADNKPMGADLLQIVKLLESCAELRAENERLHAEWSEMRDAFLHDPEHDNDTINWALSIIDERHFATAALQPGSTNAGGAGA